MSVTLTPIPLGTGPGTAGSVNTYTAFTTTNANMEAVAGALDELGKPALLRGTVLLNAADGLTIGQGVSSAVRQANLAALQAAVDYARGFGKFVEAAPADIDTEGADGLVIPGGSDRFEWHGSRSFLLRHFSQGPILTWGDVTAAMGGQSQDCTIDGVALRYGVSQAGQASPKGAFRSGYTWRTRYRNIVIEAIWDSANGVFQNPAAVGMEFGPSNGFNNNDCFFFENVVEDCVVKGVLDYHIRHRIGGTKNTFRGLYLSNGDGKATPVTGRVIMVSEQGGRMDENIWAGVNIEWTTANIFAHFKTAPCQVLDAWHIEGCSMSGYAPALLSAEVSALSIRGLHILDLRALTTAATDSTGRVGAMDAGGGNYGRIFGGYGTSRIVAENVTLTVGQHSNTINVPLHLFRPDNTGADVDDQCVVRSMSLVNLGSGIVSGGSFIFDANMPAANFPAPVDFLEYTYRKNVSRVERPDVNMTGSATVYASYDDPILSWPGAIGAARTVTLSNKSKASGSGQNIKPRAGQLVTILRGASPDAFALTVNNHDGTALASITTAGRYYFQFDGTSWAAVT